MKKKIVTRLITAALVASMAVSMTACSGKNLISGVTGMESEEGAEGDGNVIATATVDPNGNYFSTEYITNFPTEYKEMGNIRIKGDSMFFTGSNDDYSKNFLVSYNVLTGESKVLREIPNTNLSLINADDVDVKDLLEAENEFVGGIYPSADGSVIVNFNISKYIADGVKLDFEGTTANDCIKWFMKAWNEDEEVAERDLDMFMSDDTYKDEKGNPDYAKLLKQLTISNIPQEKTSYLVMYDKDGNEISQIDITPKKKKGKKDDQTTTVINDVELDKDGNIFVCINEFNYGSDNYKDIYYVNIFDKSGKFIGKFEPDSVVYDLMAYNGKVGKLDTAMDSVGYVFREIDVAKLSFGDEISFGNNYVGTFCDMGDGKLLLNEGQKARLLDVNTLEKVDYIDWLDCDISSSSVYSMGVLSDGRILVYLENYDYIKGESKRELAILTAIDYTQVAPKVEMKMACFYLDRSAENAILDFNRHSDDYRIKVETFDEGSGDIDWETAVKEYYAKLVSDTSIDIIMFNMTKGYKTMQDFARKGLLVDLKDYMNADGTMKVEDLVPSAQSAFTIDDKLVGVPSAMTVSTVIGKKSDVKKYNRWNVDAITDVLASKPKGTELFVGMTKNAMLESCLSLGYEDYIDVATNTCNFNNESFKKTLKLANLFPDTFDWDAFYMENSSDLEGLTTGKTIFKQMELYSFEDLQIYEKVYGEPITAVGYPSESGGGALIDYSTITSITKNCENPGEAWKAIAPIYAKKFNTVDDAARNWQFSTRKDDFETFCEYSMKERQEHNTIVMDGIEVEVGPASTDFVDMVKDVVYNAKGVVGAMPSEVLAIIEEEAGAYFSGQKSADEVANIVQSRVQVYLSETE